MTDDEKSFFGCKEGPFYQYNQANDVEGGVETNQVAAAGNGFRGCHYQQTTPCYETQVDCSITLIRVRKRIESKMRI